MRYGPLCDRGHVHRVLRDGDVRHPIRTRASPIAPLKARRHQAIDEGSPSEAQWYSYGVNQSDGLRRTNDDQERAVFLERKVPRRLGRSDRELFPFAAEIEGDVAVETLLDWKNKLGRTGLQNRAGIRRPVPEAARPTSHHRKPLAD